MKKELHEMTEAEEKKASALNAKEQAAVDAFIAAARALPKSLCVDVDDDSHGWGNLIVSKRVGRASCIQVASLKKKSLKF